MPEPETILCLVRDLMFMSKLRSTAAAIGRPIVCLRDPKQLTDQPAKMLLVDLNQDGAIAAAAAWRAATGAPVIGFVSHVDAATTLAAREAGIDRVMARSRFVVELESLLAIPK